MLVLNQDIVAYVEKNIMPRYKSFDKGHDEYHVKSVIKSGLELAVSLEVDADMVYVICAYHDLGLESGRNEHEINSGIILKGDEGLKRWFSAEQIEIMKEAVEDHRASSKREPRTIYGKIVSSADRDISIESITYRSIHYGVKNFPELNYEQQFQRVCKHIEEKYGEGGYIKTYLNDDVSMSALSELRNSIKDKVKYRQYYDTIYQSIMSAERDFKS